MKQSPDQFTELFAHFVYRSAYTPGQLAGLSGVPKTTIVNWLNGRVRRPRGWRGVVSLAVAMRLTLVEVDRLLGTVGRPTVGELRLLSVRPGRDDEADSETQALLSFWSDAGAVSRSQKAVPFQAIALTPTFVGREAVLAELEAHLRSERHGAIYCLHGMAGVGKTTLAAQVAYRVQDHFADGVLWARLDGSDTMSILATFAEAYGQDVSRFGDVTGRSRVVRGLLQEKQALIVLDNAVTSEQVAPLLPPTGRCAVLVTTRKTGLSVLVGARRVAVGVFSTASTGSGQTESQTSLALFKRILGTERVNAEATTFAKIAETLGHHPLALTIAASRLAYEPGWEAKQFAKQIEQTEQRLATLRFEVQSVRRSFDVSFGQLDEEARRVFAGIGRFARYHFSTTAVAGCVGLPAERVSGSLRALHNLSLVESVADGRFQVHPLLHDFAAGVEIADNFLHCQRAWWLSFVTKYADDHAVIRRELPHVFTILDSAIAAKQVAFLWKLLDQVAPRLTEWGAYEQATGYLSQALFLLEQADETEGLCRLLLRRGQLARQQQALAEATQFLQRGLQLAQKGQTACFLTELGIVHNCLGEYERGKAELLEALEIARDQPPDEMMTALLEELGVLAVIEGDRVSAESYYREGLDLAVALQKEVPQVLFLKSLGALRHLEGDRATAKTLFERGHSLARQIGFRKGMMLMSNNLGVIAYFDAVVDEAKQFLLASLDEAKRLHDLPAVQLVSANVERLGRGVSAESPDRLRVFI